MNKTYNEFLQKTSLTKNENPTPQKSFSAKNQISLPDPANFSDKQINFLELIELRATSREYTAELLTLQELSYLLWCTQGVKMTLPNGLTKRTAPSAGCIHPFNTYLYIQKVKDLTAGLYVFNEQNHSLIFLADKEEVETSILNGFKNENLVKTSAVTFIWVADIKRESEKFAERGLRYMFLDAGHIAENLYLAGETIDAGVCAIGAFYDDALNAALGLNAEEEVALYAASVGKQEIRTAFYE